MYIFVSAREKIEVLPGLFIHECWNQRVGDPVLEVRLGHHGRVHLPWSVAKTLLGLPHIIATYQIYFSLREEIKHT